MRISARHGVAAIGLGVGMALLAIPSGARAQAVQRAVGVVAVGVSDVRLAWTGTASILSIRHERILLPALAFELGTATLFHSANDTAILLPEIGIHALAGRTTVIFAGLGGGVAIPLLGEARTAVTGHAAVGVRRAVTQRMMLQVEARFRAHNGSRERTIDLTFGFVRRLPAS